MFKLSRVLGASLGSDARLANAAQMACFIAGPAIMIVAIRGVTRMATSPFEILLGVLMSVAVALLMVIMGLIVPLSQESALLKSKKGQASGSDQVV